MMRPATERFWEKVDKRGPDECWPWKAVVNGGYGRFYINGRTVQAHRFSCELIGRPIPRDLVGDHLCRNQLCVNPAHIEAVTVRENTLRGVCHQLLAEKYRAITSCSRGHAFDEANTHICRKSGRRACRTCRRDRGRERNRIRAGNGLTGPAINQRVIDWGVLAGLRAQGLSLTKIAAHFGVRVSNVCRALNRMKAHAASEEQRGEAHSGADDDFGGGE